MSIEHQAGDDIRLYLTVEPIGNDGAIPVDGTTTAAPVAYLDDDPPRTLPAQPVGGDRALWSALLTNARPGIYSIVWTVVGTGAGVQTFNLPVGPAHDGEGRSYATTGDLAHYLRAAPPAESRLLLVRATARVDELLFAARYRVDEHGVATDERVRAAIVEAVCAQAAWFDEAGDDTGSGYAATAGPAKIGNVQIGGTTGHAGAASARYAPATVAVLRRAGLLNSHVAQR